MRMILASNNQKKLREMQTILSDLGIELVSQRDAGCNFEVDETGETFEENSLLKAEAVLFVPVKRQTVEVRKLFLYRCPNG